LVPLHIFVDSVQSFVQLLVKDFVAGLDEGQSFGGESEVSCRGEICFIGGSVSLVEVAIVEIGMRVGSCDEDACDEKSDGCD